MKLTVVRHGETNENALGIVQGQSLGTLSATGKEQIQEVGRTLTAEHFDICYSSDLPRCVETAAAITQHHDGLQAIFDERLRERSMKPLEGKYFSEIEDWDWENDRRLDYKTAEGETWADVHARVRSFLDDIKSKHSDDGVLVVTHGGPIRAMSYLLDGGDWAIIGRTMVDNCEVRRWEI